MTPDAEIVRLRIQGAIASSEDVSAHSVQLDHGNGPEAWIDVHLGDAHFLQLPRVAFLEALYFGATQELDRMSDAGPLQ